jgi:tetratricopeptide (TPR) repeat protein
VAGGDSVEKVGQRIRRLRVARGLSQRDVSGPGVSYAYVSRIEAGQRNPSIKALRVLAGKLAVSPEYLETGLTIPAEQELELRVADAELELRLGDSDRAINTLTAVIDAGAGGSHEARALAALGIFAERRADYAHAVRLLEAAIESPHVSPERRADVYETLARAYLATGAANDALPLLERSLEHVSIHAPDDATLHVRYRTFLGETFAAIGRLDRAREVLAEAVERAEGYSLSSARVVLYWSLARVAWMQADSDAALGYMARAIGLLEVSDDTLQLARAHLVSGQICNLDGRVTEAGKYLAQADRLFALDADTDDLGNLRAEQAKHAAKLGDPQRALALARDAIEALADDSRYAAGAWHALAMAQAAGGDLVAADASFRTAVDRLQGRRQWREAASVARDWADALREAGRPEDAQERLNEARLLDRRETEAAAPKA